MHPTRHLVFFLSSTGRSAPCTPPCFPPLEVPPSCDIDEAACFPHAVSFSLFFSSTGRCAPCTPPCFLSFFPLEALLLGDQRGSVHPTRSLVFILFFIDGGGTRPHSGSFPRPVGGFLFFPQPYRQRGQCMTHAPLSLCFPLFIRGFFFSAAALSTKGWRTTRPPFPPVSPTPHKSGGIFLLQLLNTGAVYYPHAAPRLSRPLIHT